MGKIVIRKLKANLSRYLKQVRSGETLIVTDRKKEIAIISPFERENQEEKITQLIKRGLVSWSGGKPSGLSSRIASRSKSVSKAVVEDRR